MENKLGKRVKEIRLARGIKQKDFAKQLEIPISTLANYETGRRAIGTEMVQKISKELGVSLSEIFEEEGKNSVIGRVVDERTSVFERVKERRVLSEEDFYILTGEIVKLQKDKRSISYTFSVGSGRFSIQVREQSGFAVDINGEFDVKHERLKEFCEFIEGII